MALVCLTLAAAALVASSPERAAAAPALEVELSHSPETMPRNFEQLTYDVVVANAASAELEPGRQLTCKGSPPAKAWAGEPGNVYSFAWQWVRDGVRLESPADVASGSQSPTYTVQAADAGAVLQCLVTGTNVDGTGSFVVASQPPTFSPTEGTQPPRPNSPTLGGRRPAIAGPLKAGTEATAGASWAAGEELRCTAPAAAWGGAPVDSWSFEWLRDGQPAPGAATSPTPTTSRYALTAADVSAPEAPAVFQCLARATNSAGSTVVESAERATAAPAPGFTAAGTPGFAPAQAPFQVPVVEDENVAAGPIEVELVLPSGEETSAFEIETGAGWSCVAAEATPTSRATVSCTRAAALGPGVEAAAISVRTMVGADAPSPLEATVSVTGPGATGDTALDVFEWQPALPFAIDAFSADAFDPLGGDFRQAGGHPESASVTFGLQDVYTRASASGSSTNLAPIESPRIFATDLPPGFVGNPEAAPQKCNSVDAMLNDQILAPKCPPGSVVGGIVVDTSGGVFRSPIYAVEPEPGLPAQFNFVFKGPSAVYTLRPRLRADEGYAISVDSTPAPRLPTIISGVVTLCSHGANLFEEPSKIIGLASCKARTDVGAAPVPLLTVQTRCTESAPQVGFAVDTWERPGSVRADGSPDLGDPAWHRTTAEVPTVTGCDAVPFSPRVEIEPTSRAADSPTGLDVRVSMPTDGLESPGGIAQSHLKGVRVVLPEGMAVNAASAAGLSACSSDQIRLGSNEPSLCPASSRVGTATVSTPLLGEALQGGVYLAAQGDNPFGTLIALYLVVESEERGIRVKIPGRVDFGSGGQLIATFAQNPEVPFGELSVRFNAGPRAPLVTPRRCGTHSVDSELSPWSAANPDAPTPGEVRRSVDEFSIDQGPGGGACPGGALGFQLRAGLDNPVAGSSSPFAIEVSRADGSQRFRSLEVSLPPGLAADISAVPYCPESALAAISGAQGTARSEVTDPACPAASQVGSVVAGVGAGPLPYYVHTGRAYLAGPYKGAPLSLAAVVPALAGPFDLGSVVIRSQVRVDPTSAAIRVISDPLPTQLHGIRLDVRDVRVRVDRPEFTRAPTSCQPMAIGATVGGDEGGSEILASRFQVGDCAALPFRPKVRLRFRGQTKRAGHPALRAVVTMPPGDANVRRAVVALPPTQIIDPLRIGNVCTRPKFAARECPPNSILGNVVAWSPLLKEPLRGPVIFRANGGERLLPDIVADLRGEVDIELVGFVKSIVNRRADTARIRNTFAIVPDAPVSRFVLNLKGGKEGLLQNNTNICRKRFRATANLFAQNGLVRKLKPVVANDCGKRKPAKGEKRPR